MSPAGDAPSTLVWLRDRASVPTRRPVLLVAILAVAFVAYQWWWISHARFLGALDVDEAGSILTSLRFHTSLTQGPGHLLDAFFGTGNGPLVPLLSVPFIAVFGRSATSPMFVQPVLVAISAVAVAGAARLLAGRGAAIIAGLVTLTMPALITSSRTDQFSNGVGAAMCLAMWALLSSKRLTRTWPTVAFGAACGAMTISRTMSVSFLPAMAVAAMCLIGHRSRRAWTNLVLAAATAAAVAVPWWWAQWDYVSAYLRSSGYGNRSFFFGSSGILGRLSDHVDYLGRDLRTLVPIGFFVIALGAMAAVAGIRRSPRAWFQANRALIAVWATYLVGSAALLSSANRGVWFSTPLDSIFVLAVVATGARVYRSGICDKPAPVLLAGVVAFLMSLVAQSDFENVLGRIGLLSVVIATVVLRRRGGAAVAAVATALCVGAVAASVPLTGSTDVAVGSWWRLQLVAPIESYLSTAYFNDSQIASRDITTREHMAHEWAAAGAEVSRSLYALRQSIARAGGKEPEVLLTGSRGLFDFNVLGLSTELEGLPPAWVSIPSTYRTPDSEIAKSLTPTADDGSPRIVVAIEGRAPPFVDSLGWHRLVVLAERSGWEVHDTIRLPDRGRVVIYTHSVDGTTPGR